MKWHTIRCGAVESAEFVRRWRAIGSVDRIRGERVWAAWIHPLSDVWSYQLPGAFQHRWQAKRAVECAVARGEAK